MDSSGGKQSALKCFPPISAASIAITEIFYIITLLYKRSSFLALSDDGKLLQSGFFFRILFTTIEQRRIGKSENITQDESPPRFRWPTRVVAYINKISLDTKAFEFLALTQRSRKE